MKNLGLFKISFQLKVPNLSYFVHIWPVIDSNLTSLITKSDCVRSIQAGDKLAQSWTRNERVFTQFTSIA